MGRGVSRGLIGFFLLVMLGPTAVAAEPQTGMPVYDHNNVFARILRGELPARKVYEDDYALAFWDIDPQAPVHILVIPKGAYINMIDFTAKASPQMIAGFFQAVGKTAHKMGLDEGGYRIISNAGHDGHQTVFHLHVHIVGGKALGPGIKTNKAE